MPEKIEKNGVVFYVEASAISSWFWGLIGQNEWEADTFEVFDRYLKPDKTYLDIGAWIGPTVLYGANRAKRVMALEPDPVAYAELCSNLQLNPELNEKVISVNAALSGTAGEIKLYKRGHFGDSTSSLLPSFSEDHYTSVRALPIEELVKECKAEEVNFIKMDIEGGEFQQIPHLAGYLKELRPAFYVSLHPAFLEQSLALTGCADIAGEKMRLAEEMLNSLSFYQYIYDWSGNPEKPEDALEKIKKNEFVSYIFTDEAWI
ncbi:FkbM family methyltransferase [Metabacillus sp. GX 13764]|uniref:FkbM family methyltransferase n=1 Tax=Metabacillus kandeliae TaxID=2900151 RepID=UPI001E35317C|nr:FkbM family methyltransferase [Metabacillus kandeliae]MCD7035417.1 FkbM family methyltransferase [Metabacillus kandeliae]